MILAWDCIIPCGIGKVNADVKDRSLDAEYNKYMLRQLDELIDIVQPYTNIVEFWFDGGWEKRTIVGR